MINEDREQKVYYRELQEKKKRARINQFPWQPYGMNGWME